MRYFYESWQIGVCLLLAVGNMAAAFGGTVSTLDDIDFWVGSGNKPSWVSDRLGR